MTDQEAPLQNRASALDDFQQARRKAVIQNVIGWLKGEPRELLSFYDVKTKLKAHTIGKKVLKNIPLDSIVGSVNRYQDFTREFLPKKSIDGGRWANVQMGTINMQGLPPIVAYQIGDVYFVSDGNHRVSVARQLGADTIQGYVTEINTRVPLSPDDSPDDLIIKAEYVVFLENTQLDTFYPDADMSVTVPGAYQKLLEHISTHQYYMGLERKHEIAHEDAVKHWYEQVYLPVVSVLCDYGLLHEYPERSEADLYLWMADYRSEVENEVGMELKPEAVASQMRERFSKRIEKVTGRLHKRILTILLPDAITPGPPPGEWRREKSQHKEGRLFTDILVPVSGRPEGWNALEQALLLARYEDARLRGLHVAKHSEWLQTDAAQKVQESFERRCLEAGIEGKMVFSTGGAWRKITQLAAWNDLVIVNLACPPGPHPLSKWNSGFRNLVLQSPRPILAVPQKISRMEHALLAFNDSPRAREALYVAAYLYGAWKISLTVLSVMDNEHIAQQTIAQALQYLDEHEVKADYIKAKGPVAPSILITSEEVRSDFIIVGGYGSAPLINIFKDDIVDQVLRQSRQPMLLCG